MSSHTPHCGHTCQEHWCDGLLSNWRLLQHLVATLPTDMTSETSEANLMEKAAMAAYKVIMGAIDVAADKDRSAQSHAVLSCHTCAVGLLHFACRIEVGCTTGRIDADGRFD